jgi:hypothetical protein
VVSEDGIGIATPVSGVVYSALPSGSGILVVANGTSTTIAVSSTGDEGRGSDGPGRTTSTGSSDGNDADESEVAYAGAASPGRYGDTEAIGWAGYVIVGRCLIYWVAL